MNLKTKMKQKLQLNKKNLKNLSLDENVIPTSLTNQVGGASGSVWKTSITAPNPGLKPR